MKMTKGNLDMVQKRANKMSSCSNKRHLTAIVILSNIYTAESKTLSFTLPLSCVIMSTLSLGVSIYG